MARKQTITFHGDIPYNSGIAYRMIVREVRLQDRSTALQATLEHLNDDYAGRRVEATFKLPARPNSLATALYAACGYGTSPGAKAAVKAPEGKTVRVRFTLPENSSDWTIASFEPDEASDSRNASG